MYRYFYDAEGQTFCALHSTLGGAIDAAMMDMISPKAKPVKVQDFSYNDVFDFGDLQWLYARTWNSEYDRTTGAVVQR